MLGIFVYKRFGQLIAPSTPIKVVGATALMGLVGIYFHTVGLWLIFKYSALFGFYLLILILSGELTLEDLHPFALWKKA